MQGGAGWAEGKDERTETTKGRIPEQDAARVETDTDPIAYATLATARLAITLIRLAR
jgi:hypothetical protein